ncbi:uncharacterized protein [Ambystoma mexicanum]|uniref:uncharacterized protein isoform X3 n=1 Tax=Ambystoma mexicanum TaxID=8296 RepID=UPI0037E94BF9
MSSSEQDLAEGPLTQLINLLTSQDDQPREQEYQLPKKEFRHPGKEDQRLRQGDQCPEGEYRHLGLECQHLSLGKQTLGQENLHMWQETCQRQQVGLHLGQSEGPLWQEDRAIGQENQQPVIGQVCRALFSTPKGVSSHTYRPSPSEYFMGRSSSSQCACSFQMPLGNDIAPPKIFNVMEEEEEDFDGVLESLPACETLLLHISSSFSSTESFDCQPLDELWTCDVEPTENPGSVPPNWQSSHFTASCQKDGIHQLPMPEDCLYQSSSLFSDKESSEMFDQSTDPQIESQDEKDQGNRQAQITSIGDKNSILEILRSAGVPHMDEDRAQLHCQEKACITGMQKWAFSSQPKEDLNHDPAEITVDTLNAHVFIWAQDLEKGTFVPQDKGKKLIREMQKRIFNNEDTEGHEATTSTLRHDPLQIHIPRTQQDPAEHSSRNQVSTHPDAVGHPIHQISQHLRKRNQGQPWEVKRRTRTVNWSLLDVKTKPRGAREGQKALSRGWAKPHTIIAGLQGHQQPIKTDSPPSDLCLAQSIQGCACS